MCIVFFWFSDCGELILASNRDEVLSRPTAPADFWPSKPDIFGGRDMVSGGTWLGIAQSGKRWATILNFRESGSTKKRSSRGSLVSGYLDADVSPGNYCRQIDGDEYEGFNAIFGDAREVWFATNRGENKIVQLEPGWHSLSNGFLHSNWAKERRGLARFKDVVSRREKDFLPLILMTQVLADEARVEPATGTGCTLELEEHFASVCVPVFLLDNAGTAYGTRTSTVLIRTTNEQNGTLLTSFHERDLLTHGDVTGEASRWSDVRTHSFALS